MGVDLSVGGWIDGYVSFPLPTPTHYSTNHKDIKFLTQYMALRNVIFYFLISLWELVSWCRNEAQEIQEEVQRLCRSSFFRRCSSVPNPPAPVWVRLPGAYPVWDLLRRRQQLEWAKEKLEYMSAADGFMLGGVGILLILVVITIVRIRDVVSAKVKDIVREQTLKRISRLKQSRSGLILIPRTFSELHDTEPSKSQSRPPSSVALPPSGGPAFIA